MHVKRHDLYIGTKNPCTGLAELIPYTGLCSTNQEGAHVSGLRFMNGITGRCGIISRLGPAGNTLQVRTTLLLER